MLITFSGLDGAGKTTLIAWLQRRLEHDARRPVTVLHQNDHVGLYAWARAVRDRLRGSRYDGPPRIERRVDGVGRVRDALLWSTTLRRIIYPIDLLIFLVYRIYVEKARGRILIMDRYFYDTLVDVADGRSWRWLRLLARVTPRPDLSVLLVIPPEAAFARKGEYNVAYLARRDVAYRTIGRWFPDLLELPALEPEAARHRLACAMAERLAS